MKRFWKGWSPACVRVCPALRKAQRRNLSSRSGAEAGKPASRAILRELERGAPRPEPNMLEGLLLPLRRRVPLLRRLRRRREDLLEQLVEFRIRTPEFSVLRILDSPDQRA